MNEWLHVPGSYSPYETGRYTDQADNSLSIVLKKPTSSGLVEIWLEFSAQGIYESAGLEMHTTNGLELRYSIKKKGLNLTATNKVTDFGSVKYDLHGNPRIIRPEPFYPTETTFWKDAPTPEDKVTLRVEMEEYARRIRLLEDQFGTGKIPLETLPNIDEVCPVYASYRSRLRTLEALDYLSTQRIARIGGSWVVLEDIHEQRSFEEIDQEIDRINRGEVSEWVSWLTKKNSPRKLASASWGEPLIFNENLVHIIQSDNRLIFRQESGTRTRRKIISVPLHVDYDLINALAQHPADFDKVITEYPTSCYAEL